MAIDTLPDLGLRERLSRHDPENPADGDGDDRLLPVLADAQSAPVETRPYVEIRPSGTPVDAHAVEQAMNLLLALLREGTRVGLRHKLTRSESVPIVEWLLVSDGREDASVRYLVGTTDDELVEDLEGILRTCFPNTYELRTIEWHPRLIEEHLTTPADVESPPGSPAQGPCTHPAITAEHPYAAGVDYRGWTKRRYDWQTPLTPFDALVGVSGPAREHSDSRRVPLAPFLETLLAAPVPTMVQVTVTAYHDWSSAAQAYTRDLEIGTVSLGDKVWEVLSPREAADRQRYDPPPADQERIDGIAARPPRHTFCIKAESGFVPHQRILVMKYTG